jgi:DNA-binding transcriptional LysR family regulator
MTKERRLTGNQINWNQIFYFSEIAASGSLKDAAIKLDLSPSTLSEHIGQLEKDLEVQLFYRQHRKLILTPEGNRLYLRAKEMFEAGQRLIDVVSPVPLGCYPVSIGLVPCPSLQGAYTVVSRYLRAHGPLNLKLFHSNYHNLEQRLSRAEIDFGFSDRAPERKDLVCHLVSSSPLRFYVSSRFKDSSFSDLIPQLPLLIANAEPHTRSLAEQALMEADMLPHSVVTSDYPSALVDLCEEGLGIGVFGDSILSRIDPKKIRNLRYPKDTLKMHENLYVIWLRDGENTQAIKHLREIIHLENEIGTT